MLKKLLLLLCFVYQVNAQDSLHYSIDLNRLQHDRLTVNVKLPAGVKEFCFPKMVPGTYAIYNFGRFVSNMQAFDATGKALSVVRKDTNTFFLPNAYTLSYEVDDSWDSPEIKGPYIFEPAGTNFQQDTLFALNTHALLGYVKGKEQIPVSLQLTTPKGLVASTSLSAQKDIYTASSFQQLTDAPILVAPADTVHLHLANADILISVYSPNQKIKASEVAKELKPLLKAQLHYLGGRFPVNNYAFLIVMSAHLKNGSYGALEHAQSSFYYLPEDSIEVMGPVIRDVSAHEFFHIQTPLNLHSEEIGSFDFQNPSMSKHLWLYEGLTEYAAQHMQLQGDLITLPAFLERMTEKYRTMNFSYDNSIPFTKMSKGVLGKYKEEYGNVYQKGALIGLCLDIFLRSETDGRYGTQQLIRDLSARFGPNKSFQDEDLFKLIAETSKIKGVESFFSKYVSGNKDLPLNEMLEKIGCELSSPAGKKDKVALLEAIKQDMKEIKNPSPSQLNLRKAWMTN
ncbi:M61 family metallopeptidase [Aquirufa novilacunae]|jgi:predicted metalloprotease with PDZ domain|uniref:Peptidase M61 n=1 Tax=Aquirufa novilacunae TaxID=3139305 RepID=A0ABW8TZU7_9BACT